MPEQSEQRGEQDGVRAGGAGRVLWALIRIPASTLMGWGAILSRARARSNLGFKGHFDIVCLTDCRGNTGRRRPVRGRPEIQGRDKIMF